MSRKRNQVLQEVSKRSKQSEDPNRRRKMALIAIGIVLFFILINYL